MGEKIADYLLKLEGITYKEWRLVKTVIENKYAEVKEKNTFKLDESALENINAICQ